MTRANMTWEDNIEAAGWKRLKEGDRDYDLFAMVRYRKEIRGVVFLGMWTPYGIYVAERGSEELVNNLPNGNPVEIEAEINDYLDCKAIMNT